MSQTEYQKQPPRIDYQELRLECPRQQEEPLTMLLLDNGAEGVEIIDNQPIMQHLQAGDWDASVFDGQQLPVERIALRTLLPDGPESAAAIERIRAAITQLPGVTLSQRLQPPVDWQEKWKEGFDARPIGRRLWLRPCWDTDPIPAERTPLTVDPGLVFGTGDHPTTEMALQLLEECLQPGMRVLDLGCGSGILGIAALQLGASRVTGVDIDENCARAVAEHLQLNRLDAARFRYITGDVSADPAWQEELRQEKAPLLLANINAAVLRLLAPVLPHLLPPGGCAICSGVLAKWGDELMETMEEHGMPVLRRMDRGEWCSFVVTAAVRDVDI